MLGIQSESVIEVALSSLPETAEESIASIDREDVSHLHRNFPTPPCELQATSRPKLDSCQTGMDCLKPMCSDVEN